MLEREAAAYRNAAMAQQSRITKKQLDQSRREEMVAANTSKFGNVTIGIHGGDLPKFSDEHQTKEFWKNQRTNKEPPKIQSRVLLKQSQQFWAKNDLNLLADVTDQEIPIDTFKEARVPKAGEKLWPDKV